MPVDRMPWVYRLAVLVALLIVPLPALAQTALVIQPGETATGMVPSRETTERTTSGTFATSTVSFADDAPRHYMRVFTHADICAPAPLQGQFCTGGLRASATARAKLYVDFCVPRAGQTTCDAALVPGGGSITVSISANVGILARVWTIGGNPSAELQLAASVVPRAGGRTEAFDELVNVKSGKLLPESTDVFVIPIPLPEFENEDTADPVVLTPLLQRGVVYRFQLSVLARTRSGIGGATVNVRDRFLRRPDGSGNGLLTPGAYVMLHDLSIRAATAGGTPTEIIDSLSAIVAALQEQVGRLLEKANTAEQRFSDLTQELLDRQQDVEDRTTSMERRTTNLESTTDELHRQVRRLSAGGGTPTSGPQVAIDSPRAGATVGGSFHVGGWALDLGASAGTGIATIHVWATPTGGGPSQFIGVPAFGPRPDVATKYGTQFTNAGFGLTVTGLAPGTYDLAVYPWSDALGGFLDARVVRVVVQP
jgi:hypothetical protein